MSDIQNPVTITEGMPVEAHRWGLDKPAADLPMWGDQIRFDGISVQRSLNSGVEIGFQIPQHLFWFRLTSARSRAQVNGTRVERCEAAACTAGFVAANTEAYIRTEPACGERVACDAYLRFAVDPDRLALLVGGAAERHTVTFPDAVMPEHVDSLVPLGLTLSRIFQSPENYTALYTELLVDTFLMRAALRWSNATNVARRRTRPGEGRFRLVTDYIEDHLEQRISLEDLASLAGVSLFHFARGFKDAIGVSPHAYVTGRRVARARRLLSDPGLSLAEVAARCGFSSQSHFTTIFRKTTGVTPARYRRDQT